MPRGRMQLADCEAILVTQSEHGMYAWCPVRARSSITGPSGEVRDV